MQSLSNGSKVILDFDGVICKNRKLYHEVNMKSVTFVSQKTQFSFDEALHFNNKNYKKHGHTVNMLKNYGIQTSLKEYNEFVFDDTMWDKVSKSLTNRDILDILNIKAFNSIIEDKSILFSNAPSIWCCNIVNMCGFTMDELFDDVYTCEDNED